MAWHPAASADAVGEDEAVGVKVAGQDIAICRIDGTYYALHNVCTHQFALLSDGYVEDGCIECPLHQGKFEIRTGKAMGPPVTEDVRTFPVRVEGNQIFVEIE